MERIEKYIIPIFIGLVFGMIGAYLTQFSFMIVILAVLNKIGPAVIGAVFGTVSTIIVTHRLKTKGKVLYIGKPLVYKWFYIDPKGNQTIPLDMDKAESVIVELRLCFYNTKDIPVIFKDMKIVFKTTEKTIELFPLYRKTEQFSMILDILDIPPKTPDKYFISNPIAVDDLSFISKIDHCYFIANDYRNTRYEYKIDVMDYMEYSNKFE